MGTMRTFSAGILLAGLGFALSATPAAASEASIMRAVWKFHRGMTNVAVGLPSEIGHHGIRRATENPDDTGGGFLSELLTGCVQGFGWGVLRLGSGLVDVATFPVPFNDNRPLVEPEFAL